MNFKARILFTLLLLLGLNACKKEDNLIPLWFVIKNYSDFDLTLKSTKGEPDIILKKGEIKDVPTNYGLQYDIIPDQPTTKIFEFLVQIPSVAEIYSYDYKLEYTIEGTAEKADIEIVNDRGVTESYKNVTLPVKYQFKTFCNCFASASARRVGDIGNVKIKLYKRGRFIRDYTSETQSPAVVHLDHW